MEIERLIGRAKMLDDLRRRWGNLRHKLVDIIVIGICAVLSGGDDFVDMEEVGNEREAWFREFLELPNGITGQRHVSASI
jgi:hypothetical protein